MKKVARVAFVTGSARGIGKGVALCLAKRGWNLAINYVSSKDAAETTAQECQSHGVESCVIRADVGDTQSHEAVIEEIHSKMGRIDLLVNNAGIGVKQRMDLLDASTESFDQLINTNLRGPYFLTQKMARYFIAQQKKLSEYQPKIIFVTSISAYTSSPMRGEYCVSKAGLSMATKVFADRLAENGIPVYEIRPGVIQTDMTSVVKDKYDALIAGGLTPIKRWGQPEDIGQAVIALAEGLFPFSTGDVFNVDGGFHLHRL